MFGPIFLTMCVKLLLFVRVTFLSWVVSLDTMVNHPISITAFSQF